MFTTIEIEVSELGEWVDYFQIDGESEGSVHSTKFPDKPELGNRYYLITSGSVIKGVARKLISKRHI